MTERVPLLRKVTQPNGQTSELTIEQALRDTNLLGSALGEVSSWSNWLTVLKAAFGQELTASELAVFEQVAGERPVPTSRVRELWAIVGRRGRASGEALRQAPAPDRPQSRADALERAQTDRSHGPAISAV